MGRNTFDKRHRGNVSRRGAACIWAAVLSLAVGAAGRVFADAITVVSGLDNPNDLQLYDGNLYFVDTSTHPNDTLANVSTDGGTANVLFSGLANYEPDIGGYSGIGNYSVGSTGVFGGYGDYDNTTMFAGNSATGTTQTLASSYGGIYMGQSDGNVYYSSNFRDINAVSAKGGSSTPVTSGVWVRGMTTDTTGTYFQDYWSQDILKFSYATQSVLALTGPQNASPFATDSGSLYLNVGGGGIDSVAQTGGMPTAVISGSNIAGYAAANGNVFYTNGNTIEQYSVAAAKSIPLTTILAGNVTSMTTDGNWLYYTVSNGSAGTVNKVPVAIATVQVSLTPVATLTHVFTPPPAQVVTLQNNSVQVSNIDPNSQGLLVYSNGQFSTTGTINRSVPTIVLTHGFAEQVSGSVNNPTLQWPTAMAQDIPGAGTKFNVVAWNWSTEAQNNMSLADSRTSNEGAALGTALSGLLGPAYTKPIHFIGHSLGALVNSEAIVTLNHKYPALQIQDTLLDEASIANGFPGTGLPSGPPAIPVNSAGQPIPMARVDNYVSSFGNVYSEAANFILQQDPNTMYPPTDYRYWMDFHNYPVSWYEKTITNAALQSLDLGYTGAIEGSNFNVNDPMFAPGVYAAQSSVSGGEYSFYSLTPKEAGIILLKRNNKELDALNNATTIGSEWFINNISGGTVMGVTVSQLLGAVNVQNNAIIKALNSGSIEVILTKQPTASTSNSPTAIATSVSKSSAVSSLTSSSYAWIPVAIPSHAQFMSLDLTFHGLSPGDFLSIGINDMPLFQLEDEYVRNDISENTGLIDISQWSGQDVQLFLGLVAADDNNSGGTITIDNVAFESVPEPTSLEVVIALLGCLLLNRRRWCVHGGIVKCSQE